MLTAKAHKAPAKKPEYFIPAKILFLANSFNYDGQVNS